MNLKEIKEMINLMNENDLAELEMERNGLKIRLKKKGREVYPEIRKDVAPPVSPPAEVKAELPSAKTLEIKAPMVGTFYRAPSPDAEPFVEVGDEIEKEEVICIIEAMKLMNEIKSEVKGKIIKILVENGNPVEFGQVLFLVEPT
jgi:acetyl-CoA carboxylase biotin carboxyl carrier protein